MSGIADVNINEASLLLGYSAPTIRKFIQEGMPVKTKGGRGKDYTLFLPDCVQWLGQREVKNAVGDVDQAGIDELKKRKLAAETAIAEIEAAERRSQVVFIADALKIFTSEALSVKARILAVPQRLAAALAGITEQRKIKEILTDELYECFDELSAGSVDLAEFVNSSGQQESGGKVAAAAKSKAERVGGAKRQDSRGKRKTGKN